MEQKDVRKALIRMGRRCLRHQLMTAEQFRAISKECKHRKDRMCGAPENKDHTAYCVLEECIEVQSGRVELYREQGGFK